MPSNIPFRIRQRRKELGLSQEELAKACGVGQSTVANWERGGHIPRQATLHKISKALDTNEAWILSGESAQSTRPLSHYLTRPIRHLAIFEWPKNAHAFESAQPIGYMPIASEDESLFACRISKDSDDFAANTTLVFTRDYDDTSAGLFLSLSEESCELSDEPSARSLARLIYSIRPH